MIRACTSVSCLDGVGIAWHSASGEYVYKNLLYPITGSHVPDTLVIPSILCRFMQLSCNFRIGHIFFHIAKLLYKVLEFAKNGIIYG